MDPTDKDLLIEIHVTGPGCGGGSTGSGAPAGMLIEEIRKMQVRFFTIPVHAGEEAAEELNRFLAGHRILSVDRHLVQDGANPSLTWKLQISLLNSVLEN